MSGWDNGLNQDYCKELGRWFANRVDARHVLRKVCEEMMHKQPHKDTQNPAGQVSPVHQGKTLVDEIKSFLDDSKELSKDNEHLTSGQECSKLGSMGDKNKE
jgi:hypothetical protein